MQQNGEGIVLHTLKYGDYDQILTIFTREEGLIKLFVKGAYRSKSKSSFTTPLTQAEFTYVKRQSTLFVCLEKSIINYHLKLRESLPVLEGACALVNILTTSQRELKPAPLLYELFVCYLERLPQTMKIMNLVMSFQFKLLRHEGLFGLTPYCNHCNDHLIDYYIFRGECFCEKHQPMQYSEQMISLTPFEASTLFTFAFSRSLPLIEQCEMDLGLKTKLERILLQCEM